MKKAAKLDIKKELSALTKDKLIDLLLSLSLGASFPSPREATSIVHKALVNHAYQATQAVDSKPLTLKSLQDRVKAGDEHMRVCDLDTKEIERQLVDYYNKSVVERDKRNQVEYEEFTNDFMQWKKGR